MNLRTLAPAAAAVMHVLTEGLEIGESRKLDRGDGYQPIHVECLHHSGLGVHFSVAHYLSQAGDLVPDPDVVFVRRADGTWSPVSFQNSIAHRVAVHFHDDGTIEVDEKEQRELVAFCQGWMTNIREQQGLSVPRRGGGR
jgi:hypothetical protein